MHRFVLMLIGILVLVVGMVSAVPAAEIGETWAASYGGNIHAIATDGAGNSCVTGNTWTPATGQDYATVKYDSDGNKIWEATYNGPGNLHDGAWAIAVDRSLNIYVTGEVQLSVTDFDFATVKYDPDGNELWVATSGGPGNTRDKASAIAVDALGNVYVTGSTGDGTQADFATVKYDPDGNELWAATYNGPGNWHDYPLGVAVDNAGNVYVSGQSHGDGTETDYATVKYDPDGNELWVARYDGPAHYHDYARGFALDASGNSYVTGASWSGTSYVGTMVKYDADGNELWVAGGGAVIAVDAAGNVYVGGTVLTLDGLVHATVKYDSDGNKMWETFYRETDERSIAVVGIDVDRSGNVYVTGYTAFDIPRNTYYVTLKYDPDGNEVWVARYGDRENCHDVPTSLALDASGDVLVAGEMNVSDCGTFESVTLKYGHPAPDVKVNGYDILLVTEGDPVSVTVELADQSYENWDADWWLVATSDFGDYYHYDLSGRWLPGIAVTHQGPLFDLLPTEVLNTTGLPGGGNHYVFTFGVDTVRDGRRGSGEMFSDQMTLIVGGP